MTGPSDLAERARWQHAQGARVRLIEALADCLCAADPRYGADLSAAVALADVLAQRVAPIVPGRVWGVCVGGGEVADGTYDDPLAALTRADMERRAIVQQDGVEGEPVQILAWESLPPLPAPTGPDMRDEPVSRAEAERGGW